MYQLIFFILWAVLLNNIVYLFSKRTCRIRSTKQDLAWFWVFIMSSYIIVINKNKQKRVVIKMPTMLLQQIFVSKYRTVWIPHFIGCFKYNGCVNDKNTYQDSVSGYCNFYLLIMSFDLFYIKIFKQHIN